MPQTTSALVERFIYALDELNIVANQELSIEMFLIRLLYLKNIDNKKEFSDPAVNEPENKKTNLKISQKEKL